MYTVAIVDDEQEEVNNLCTQLKRYFDENGGEYTVAIFNDGANLLKSYSPVYDVIFLDIQMNQVNGVRTAQKIRTTDKRTVIIFVTRMAKYAASGYDIGVNNFIVKPVTYDIFAFKMKKALAQVEYNKDKFIRIEQNGSFISLQESEILYVEIQQHYIYYHTQNGTYKTWGTLKQVKEALSKNQFKECNRCYLVNLRHVTGVDQNEVIVAGTRLLISRNKKKDFLETIAAFWGERE